MCTICTYANESVYTWECSHKEFDLSRVIVLIDRGAHGHDCTHTGDCMSKNVCLLQNATKCSAPECFTPSSSWSQRESHQRRIRTQRWESHLHPQPVPKAPSSLSLGGVVAAWLSAGIDRRAWVAAAWGPVRWESGSPSEELIHCLCQSWGGEQQGEGEIPQGKFGNQDSPAPESPLASCRGAPPSLCVNVGAHVCGCLPGCSIYVCVFTVWCLYAKR